MDKQTLKVILILLSILALIYVTYLTSKTDKVNFVKIDLPENNEIINQTSRSYLDTIVSIGLDEMEISGVKLYVMNLDESFKNNPSRGTGDMDLKATVFNYGKDYILYIDESVGKRESIEIITHELIHLNQYISGDLKIISKSGTVLWKGEVIETLNTDYGSRPWEIDAFSRGRKLSDEVWDILVVKN